MIPSISANLAHEAGLTSEKTLNNVIKYGYKNTRRHQFIIIVEVEGQEIFICCVDEGRKFNPCLRFWP